LLGVSARGANGTRDEEEQLLLAALERDPEHREAEKALLAIRAWRLEPVTRAWRLFHGGRTADALAAFREAYAELGARIPVEERAPIVAGIGWCHHGTGHADWGVQAFLEALAYDPKLAHAHKGLGICLYWLGRYAEAEAALRAAIALEPKLFDALAFIGWCAYALGEYERALATFEAARDGHPFLGDARWGIAWSRWKLDRVDEAVAAFREALELDPAHPSAGDVALWVLGDPRYVALLIPAAERSESSADREPAEPRPLIEALSALAEGRAAEALRILAELGELSPGERWRARLLEGRARLALEEPERALEAFRESLEIAPGRAEPALEVARTLLRMDSRQDAVKILRWAARRTVQHPDIARELERLEGRGT
jgi:tetratricopeptide (TPR) repeat protein